MQLKGFGMRFLLSAKWSAILLLNLSGSLKIFPILVLGLSCFLEFFLLSTNCRAMIATATIFLLIVYKLSYGFDISSIAETPTAFEGVSIAFLLFVLPFFRSELVIIEKRKLPVVLDVMNIICIVLVIDILMRLYVHGLGQFINVDEYSIAKEGGIFSTSNISGGLAFVLFCYALKNGFNNWRMLVSLIFLLGSLSRVSVLAASLVAAHYFYTMSIGPFFRALLRIFLICLICILFFPILEYFMSDGSFNSKIELASKGILKFIDLSSAQELMLGFPLDALKVANFLDVEGWSPHLSFLKALLYYGFIGALLWIGAHFYIWRRSNQKYVVAGGLVMGLAGLPILWPPLIITMFPSGQNYKAEVKKKA